MRSAAGAWPPLPFWTQKNPAQPQAWTEPTRKYPSSRCPSSRCPSSRRPSFPNRPWMRSAAGTWPPLPFWTQKNPAQRQAWTEPTRARPPAWTWQDRIRPTRYPSSQPYPSCRPSSFPNRTAFPYPPPKNRPPRPPPPKHPARLFPSPSPVPGRYAVPAGRRPARVRNGPPTGSQKAFRTSRAAAQLRRPGEKTASRRGHPKIWRLA